MCLLAIKTKHYSCSAYLSSVFWAITLTYTLNRLSSFQYLRRKGGKFDHRLERPKVLLRHWSAVSTAVRRRVSRCLRYSDPSPQMHFPYLANNTMRIVSYYARSLYGRSVEGWPVRCSLQDS